MDKGVLTGEEILHYQEWSKIRELSFNLLDRGRRGDGVKRLISRPSFDYGELTHPFFDEDSEEPIGELQESGLDAVPSQQDFLRSSFVEWRDIKIH